jgi:hypothetical protein
MYNPERHLAFLAACGQACTISMLPMNPTRHQITVQWKEDQNARLGQVKHELSSQSQERTIPVIRIQDSWYYLTSHIFQTLEFMAKKARKMSSYGKDSE